MDNAVKSARRVFDVLEFFEEHQRAASAIEVAAALKFPQSSTSALMRTMTDRRIRHVPVVEDGSLVGIVSIGDVVKSRISELEFERDALDQYLRQS